MRLILSTVYSKILIVLFVLIIVLAGGLLLYKDKNAPPANNNSVVENSSIGLANPASANCLKLGGTIEMRNNAKGQYGVCYFEDNRQCEEWALFRGQCPVGGKKITGYENEAQAYCVITGGEVEGLGTDSVLCKRIDGTYCQVDANFNGDCPDPNDPNLNSGNVEGI
ncbi:MAG TPA: DUF333 domain-containing protein [Candidatus Magasanikbacteria bacterium]|nr:DUF333 domain-containing protein [Candidatus Magasanikbacteria bacterium]